MKADTEELLSEVLLELLTYLRAANRAREREEDHERVATFLERRGYQVRDRRRR